MSEEEIGFYGLHFLRFCIFYVLQLGFTTHMGDESDQYRVRAPA